MVRDVGTWRALIEEYVRLERLEGHTPQSRGQRFNGMIAEALEHWGIPASASERSKGEVDVGFTHEGVRYVLEAKWEKTKADTGDLAKLHKRVQQRLSGTRGVFLAMAGFTPEAITDLSDGQRLEMLLLDRSHWEAMLSGLVPPPELLTLAGDHAAFRGEAFATLATLLARSARLPKINLEAGARGDEILEVAAEHNDAQFALSIESSDQLGLTCVSAEKLLVTTSTGIALADVDAGTADLVVEVTHCHRRAVLHSDGSILFTRRLGVGRFHEGQISSVAGGAAGATCLIEAPDGTTWLLDNGEPSGRTPGSIVCVGTRITEHERHDLSYPDGTATNAAWIAPDRLLVIGAAGFQTTTLAGDCTPIQQASQANPMGLLRVTDRVVLTSGDGITLAATDLATGVSAELARLALRGSVSELAQAATGEIYLAAYDRSANPQAFTVVRLNVVVPEGLGSRVSIASTATATDAAVTSTSTSAPATSSQSGGVPARSEARPESSTLTAFDQAVAALTAERQREHHHGYREGIAFAPALGWRDLAGLAQRNFDLKGWLEGWRNGWLDIQMGRAPDGAQAAGWLPALADRLGSLVDVVGYDYWSFTPSSAYVDGFIDGLREVWISSTRVSSGASPAPPSPATPTPSPQNGLRGIDSAPDLRARQPAIGPDTTTGYGSSHSSNNESLAAESDGEFVTVKGILGSINFNGDTVIIRKQGYGPRMKGVQTLAVSKIEKVIVKPATSMFHGYIQFVVRELPPAPDQRFSAASGRPHREDPASMSFPKRANEEIEDLRRRVEAAIARVRH